MKKEEIEKLRVMFITGCALASIIGSFVDPYIAIYFVLLGIFMKIRTQKE